MLKDCHCCKESNYARNPIGGTGPRSALVAVLGRNPGSKELQQNKPFVGAVGIELTKGLMIAGIFVRSCYLTNLCKCYTPSGVTPSRFCRKICAELWLGRELASLSKLQIVIALGNEALQYFEPEGNVAELHGTAFYTQKPWEREERIMLFTTYHPAIVFHAPEGIKRFNSDMCALKEILDTATKGKILPWSTERTV